MWPVLYPFGYYPKEYWQFANEQRHDKDLFPWQQYLPVRQCYFDSWDSVPKLAYIEHFSVLPYKYATDRFSHNRQQPIKPKSK